ncbi:MAG: hypothetical protein ACXWL2_03110 [Candidatus Chromulinivorax sp.]
MKLFIHFLKLIAIFYPITIIGSEKATDDFEQYCEKIERKITLHQLPVQEPSINYHQGLTHLAKLFDQEFNDQKIKNYAWQKKNDCTLKIEIGHDKRILTIDLFSQLYAFVEHQKTPLHYLIDKQHALYVKEAFFNALLNRWTSDHQAIKEEYDQKHGKGSFFNQYGNYRTNPNLSAAHQFATKIWKKENNKIIAQIPNEMLSIHQLRIIQMRCTDKTDQKWHTIEQELKK